MLRMLLPVDGSEANVNAVDAFLSRRDWYTQPLELHLLNVQHPISSDASRFINRDDLNQFHRDEGMKALAPVQARLDAENVPYAIHIVVGDAAETIVHFANEKKMDQIVMGARGLGSLTGLMLGSVTTRVIQLAEMPVLVLR